VTGYNLERLDHLIAQLRQILEAPADQDDDPVEWTWQRLEQLHGSMGAEALRAMLRRQGMNRAGVGAAFEVLATRRAGRSPAEE
jgi:hypothetical protein